MTPVEQELISAAEKRLRLAKAIYYCWANGGDQQGIGCSAKWEDHFQSKRDEFFRYADAVIAELASMNAEK